MLKELNYKDRKHDYLNQKLLECWSDRENKLKDVDDSVNFGSKR